MDRLSVSNLQEKISSKGFNWVAGETPLTALPAEQQDQHLGLVAPPGALERVASKLEEQVAAASFAPARDWRAVDGKDWTTPIQQQGPCGSCVSFATVATVECQARIEHKAPGWAVNLSEADLFFCGGGRLCQQGWWPAEALKYAAAKGISDDPCFPYQPQDQACNVCSDKASRLLKVGNWQEIVPIDQRKQWIDTKGPVIACMAVYRDFYNYKQGVYRHVTGELAGYHAVSCIGYSEDEGCWICKNSWGSGWGDKGFFKVGYGEVDMDTKFAVWGVEDVKGTLEPPDDEGEEEEEADGSKLVEYLAVQTAPDGGSALLLARVAGEWKQATVSAQKLASLGPIAFAASGVSVKVDGDRIVSLSIWKKY